jgi:transcriptional regulator with XRE-family HTH domain/Mn-dependent DtxR family transcriptional regulator
MRRMNQLKEFREEAGMTVRELSERSGVSEDTITKIENGHRKGRSMTLRKLAKVLEIRPDQLSPEQFERTAGAGESVSQTLTDDAFADFAVVSSPAEADIQDARFAKALISRVSAIVRKVREQSGLAFMGDLQYLSERQRETLVAVAKDNGLSPSAVAERLGHSVSIAARNLAVLEEHGLVTSHESEQRQPTAMGRGVAADLTKGEMYFDEALEYVATLTKAYESIAGIDPQSMGNEEALDYFNLQESVVTLIRDIVAVAKPSPLAHQMRENFLAMRGMGRIRKDNIAEVVHSCMAQLMSDSPSLETIRAHIKGVAYEDVFRALKTMQEAEHVGAPSGDPYEHFRLILKQSTRRYGNMRPDKTNRSQPPSVRDTDS